MDPSSITTTKSNPLKRALRHARLLDGLGRPTGVSGLVCVALLGATTGCHRAMPTAARGERYEMT
jgi:hypothetical protein